MKRSLLNAKWKHAILALGSICFFASNASAITCSICGQSNLTAPGECTTQFQYDCLPNPAIGGAQQLGQQFTTGDQRLQQKILCRTTRTKLGENLFAVIKECVTENDHLNRYPDGKAFGCETMQTNNSYPLTYCVCDQDLCNSPSLDEQLRQQTQPDQEFPIRPQLQSAEQIPRQSSSVPLNQQNRTNPNVQQLQRQSIQKTQQNALLPSRSSPILPSQIVDDFAVPESQSDASESPSPNPIQEPQAVEQLPRNTFPSKTSSNQPRVNQPTSRNSQAGNQPKPTTQLFALVNTEKVEFITDPIPTIKQGPNSNSQAQNGLECMTCNEGNLTFTQDCQTQTPVDCRLLVRPGATLFCFTKTTTLTSGQSQIEKRCASEEQLSQELALQNIQPTCFSGQDGLARTDYCICGTNKCNQLPIANQANMYPPLSQKERAISPNLVNQPWNTANASPATQKPKMCYVCGESDQAHPSDCSQQYEYDCTRQYPQSAVILCLTRQTKVASGRYNIEKRCITPAEHQLQYPDNEITLNGCNEAWNGYVQYCVCQGDYCNAQNITLQQQAQHWVRKPIDNPDDDTFDHEEINQHQENVTPLTRHQPAPSPTPVRVPNGLLIPPSTRLPLRPLQGNPANNQTTPKVEKLNTRASTAAGNGNFVQEATIQKLSTSTMNSLDNRIHHENQHQPLDNKKRGPSSSRRAEPTDNASTNLPGYLYILALIMSTLFMLH